MFAQMNVLGFKMTPWFEAQKYIENILKIFLFRTLAQVLEILYVALSSGPVT